MKIGEITLTEGNDYSESCKSNTNIGTAIIAINGTGGYQGSKSTTFKIKAADISGVTISGLAAKTYTGKAFTQNPTVEFGNTILKSSTDYTVGYKNTKNAGTATVAITGKGNYIGTKNAAFKINKAKQPMTVKAKSKTVKAKSLKKRALAAKKLVTVKKSKGKVTSKNASKAKKLKKFKATAKGNASYKARSKTVTVKVVVR